MGPTSSLGISVENADATAACVGGPPGPDSGPLDSWFISRSGAATALKQVYKISKTECRCKTILQMSVRLHLMQSF